MSLRGSEGNAVVFPLVLIGVIVAAFALVVWALVLTPVGMGVFSSGTALSLEGDALGTTGLQRALGLLANDLKDAEQTNLVDEAGWAPSVTLSWTDRLRGLPFSHVVQYTLQDDRLMRIEHGVAKVVAQDVLSTAYSLAESDFTAVFEVRAEPGESETVTLRIAMP